MMMRIAHVVHSGSMVKYPAYKNEHQKKMSVSVSV